MALDIEKLLAQLTPEQARAATASPQAFAETFLKNPDGTPFRANDVQRRIFNSPYPKTVIRVHRRAGKSHSFALIILYHMVLRKNCKILVLGPMAIHVKEVFAKVRAFIAANDWLQPYLVRSAESPQHLLVFSNGAQAVGLTTGVKSNAGALAARGQEADVLLIDEAAYLNEGDWDSLKPIMSGDAYRNGRVRVYVASTPAFTRGTYYKICKDPKKKDPSKSGYWHEIHQDLPTNPDPVCTPSYKEQCRSECTTELEWTREWLAEFPEVGQGVFPKNLVDRARVSYSYAEALERAKNEDRENRPPSRTIGVDWDKLNRDGHGPNIAVLEAQANGKMRVIYREEIPQHEFSFSKAVDRVCALNELFRPEWIFIDRGNGEYQVEEFKKRGLRNPETGLHKKVVPCWFRGTVTQPMVGGGEPDKKPFKHLMINVLRGWLEDGILQFSDQDPELTDQFIEYEIVTQSAYNVTYSSENEHGIDAVGLAAMAFFLRIKNPYGFEPATRCHVVPAPQPVPGKIARKLLKTDPDGRGLGALRNYHRALDTAGVPSSFSRGLLGSTAPVSRSQI